MISVCICTYNRSAYLLKGLAGLAKMIIPKGIRWELLVVDNNSSDDTEKIINEFRMKLPIIYVFEKNQGLSHARNRAIKECKGEVLFYLDDDAVVHPDWLTSMFRAILNFPEAGYFGGRSLPKWDKGRPSWLRDLDMPLIAGVIGFYDLGENTKIYAQSEPLPVGLNFGLRRCLFEDLEPFRIDLGVVGIIPGRGEESEYLERAVVKSYKGVYVGDALCYHHVSSKKMTLKYMYRLGIQKGIAAQRVDVNIANNGSIKEELLYGIKGLFQLLKGRGDRFRQCIINMGIQRGLRKAYRVDG
jgi:glucosyl-dolichyl phosphate glucuronosyltransferase